jgi:hypothetical protein
MRATLPLHACVHDKRFAFKRVVRSGDRDAYWNIFVVGSVWWLPSGAFRTPRS